VLQASWETCVSSDTFSPEPLERVARDRALSCATERSRDQCPARRPPATRRSNASIRERSSEASQARPQTLGSSSCRQRRDSFSGAGARRALHDERFTTRPIVHRARTRFHGLACLYALPLAVSQRAESEHPPGRLNRRRARRYSVHRDHETGSLRRALVALSALRRIGSYRPAFRPNAPAMPPCSVGSSRRYVEGDA
jgi:hypothetical protein